MFLLLLLFFFVVIHAVFYYTFCFVFFYSVSVLMQQSGSVGRPTGLPTTPLDVSASSSIYRGPDNYGTGQICVRKSSPVSHAFPPKIGARDQCSFVEFFDFYIFVFVFFCLFYCLRNHCESGQEI